MDGDVEVEVTPEKQGLEIHGPFSEYRLTVGGYQVPLISGRFHEGMLHLMLDHRFGCEIPEAQAESIVWFIANAMAVAGGYSCFGENNRPLNPFTVKLNAISFDVKAATETEQ